MNPESESTSASTQIEIFIDNHSLQSDIIDFAGWKLYNQNKFPNKRRLDDLYIKKTVDGEIVIKSFTEHSADNPEDQYMKNNNEIPKINEDEVAFQLNQGIYKINMEALVKGDKDNNNNNDNNNLEKGVVELEYVFSEKIYTVAHDLCPYKKLFLRGEDRWIRKFIAEMDSYIKKNDKNFIKIYSPSGKGYWDLICKNVKRDVQTVFIKNRKEVIDDLDEFMSSESDYQTFGHPYKRNYLFYGPPGNGKTSFINAIASKYNFRIYLISFSNAITDEIFKKLVSTIPVDGLLVLEDIDALFDEKKNISMSTVLNIMDGMARKSRIISLMTTNNYHKLTDVFKRPGRIDMTVEFGKADEECFQDMAEFMCKYHKVEIGNNRENARHFFKMIAHMEPSRALVQKFLFENRKKNPEEIFSSKMVGKFKELNQIYAFKGEENISLYS